MKQNFFSLIGDKRFGPLFWIQLLGAFHDNLFRSTLLIMVTWGIWVESLDRTNSLLLTTMIGGITIVPFLLFSSIAGQLADKYNKSYLVRVLKACDIAIMCAAIIGLITHSLTILLITLFLTMVQASFFGPIKYSYIPAVFKHDKIINANALVESSTFTAIIGATLLSMIISHYWGYGVIFLGICLLSSAVISFLLSFKMPTLEPAAKHLNLNWNLYKESLSIIQYAAKDPMVFLAIIGISWFWVIGIVMLTYILAYVRDIIGGNELLGGFFMFLFALGIGVGSYLSNRIMGKEIHARLVPWGTAGITLFIIDFVATSHHVNFTESVSISSFLATGIGWHISIDLLMIATATGLSMVPLYAIMQTTLDPDHCSRVVAANNIMNSLFMVISSIVTMILIKFNVTILNIFLIVALLNLYTMKRLSVLVPESLLQLVLQSVLKLFFRVEVTGMNNFKQAGDRVLIIANHISFIDAILLFAFIPERLSYAIYTYYINRWWIRIIRPGADLHPVDPVNPLATRKLIKLIREGRKCVIFPEGRVTGTGSLMKVFDGPGMIADRADAQILPIRIDGAQYSLFSRLKGKVRRQFFPKITVTILPPRKFEVEPAYKGRERRRIITNQLYDVMVGMIFDTSPYQETITQSLLDAAQRHGMRRVVAEDTQRDPINYRKLLMRSFILGGWLKERTNKGEYVGVMLPTSIASMLCFVSLLLVGRVPAMLNFSLGPSALIHATNLARLRYVLTSRRFMEMARLDAAIQKLQEHTKVIFLEDLRQEIGTKAKLKGLISSYFPRLSSCKIQRTINPNDPAVILFTSGSEGVPKGVALSHINLNANRFQITSLIDLTSQDVLLNVLPTFHSFGLTAGLLTPLLSGIRTFLYPSPLHYRVIPVIAYDINATIFFATDTFLNRYGLAAHPYDFYSMRYVVAGAEKLRAETRQLWMDKFGIPVYEGYGTTEASPAVAINTRMQSKVDTVGRMLPGMEYKLLPIEGIHDAGSLVIKGPNVMLGYLDPESGKIIPTSAMLPSEETSNNKVSQPGWYDTGDIVSVDLQGFVKIKGRAKRFAKLAGEMVSLTAIEDRLLKAFPGYGHVTIAVPDKRKGEQVVLLTTAPISREDILQKFRAEGMTELMVPRLIFQIDNVPVLPTGKTDLVKAKEMLKELLGS